MLHYTLRHFNLCLLVLFLGAVSLSAQSQTPVTDPVVGLQDNTPAWPVLKHASVISKPGEQLKDMKIVIKGDVIQEIRKSGTIPAGARIIDLSGKTVYVALSTPIAKTMWKTIPILSERPIGTTRLRPS